jgi:uncharacterized protein CbrC (UPF0167 family)
MEITQNLSTATAGIHDGSLSPILTHCNDVCEFLGPCTGGNTENDELRAWSTRKMEDIHTREDSPVCREGCTGDAVVV